jgi:hypothetical protein
MTHQFGVAKLTDEPAGDALRDDMIQFHGAHFMRWGWTRTVQP